MLPARLEERTSQDLHKASLKPPPKGSDVSDDFSTFIRAP